MILRKIELIKNTTNRISMEMFGTKFSVRVEPDNKNKNGRIFIQIVYDAPCTKTGVIGEWHGRKWYLSDHMTEDEVIKTCFAAYEAAVKHEIMESFKVDGKILFNPHVNYLSLLAISNDEIKRS